MVSDALIDTNACSALTERAVIAGVFACRACAVKVDLADTADIVFWDIPPPGRDGVPLLDCDLHPGGQGK
jgi:hypothetical protein